jgi:hypothetical protein
MGMRRLTIGMAVAGAIALPAPARAQMKVTLVPSVSVSAVSDDNIFATETRTADHTTLLSPGAEAVVESPRLALRGAYSFDMQRSADFSALNDLQARRHGMFDAALQQTSRLAFDLNGHYDHADESGELNWLTGLLLPRARATRWELVPSFNYKATPLVTVHGQYAWVQESLEPTVDGAEHVGRLLLSRQLSSRITISAGYLGRRFVNGDLVESSNAALVGTSYALAPSTTLTVQGGPRFSSATGLVPEITASLARRAPNALAYGIDYWRGESIILGVIGPVEVTSATGRVVYPVTPHVEIGGAAGAFKTESLVQGQARVFHAEAIASWSPRPFYAVAASYGSDFQHGDIRTSLLNDSDIVRHVFRVTLTVAPRLQRTIERLGPSAPLGGQPNGVNRD